MHPVALTVTSLAGKQKATRRGGGEGHSEILLYLSTHSASTLAVLPNLMVRERGR